MAETLDFAAQELVASPELARTTIGEVEELIMLFRDGHTTQISADGWRILEEFEGWFQSRTEREED